MRLVESNKGRVVVVFAFVFFFILLLPLLRVRRVLRLMQASTRPTDEQISAFEQSIKEEEIARQPLVAREDATVHLKSEYENGSRSFLDKLDVRSGGGGGGDGGGGGGACVLDLLHPPSPTPFHNPLLAPPRVASRARKVHAVPTMSRWVTRPRAVAAAYTAVHPPRVLPRRPPPRSLYYIGDGNW